MNKDVLISGLDEIITKETNLGVQIFVKLLKQVWQIDYTVAAYDVVGHYLAFDIPYFYRFMSMDVGDEAEEQQILIDWVSSRHALKGEDKPALIGMIDQVNQLRSSARKA